MDKINVYEEYKKHISHKWLPSWPSSNGKHIEENVNCQNVDFKDVSKRKNFFENETNRKQFQIKNNQIWNFDLSNCLIDFNDFTVKVIM